MQQKTKKIVVHSEKNNSLKIALVRSNYYGELTKSMEQACLKELIEAGVKSENIESFQAPGTWELPILVKNLTNKGFDGMAVFGVVIKGETYHFEMLANQVSQALMQISLDSNIPLAFEVLATYNLKQAEERSSGKDNKGKEAAQALLEITKELRIAVI